jgi:hypothetical protein
MRKIFGKYGYLIILSVIWLLLALMPVKNILASDSIFASRYEFLFVGIVPLVLFWGCIWVRTIVRKRQVSSHTGQITGRRKNHFP